MSFRSGKVIAGDNEQSSVSNIYAIGDILEGKLELTPVAIHAGKLLARRLFGGSSELVSNSKLAGVYVAFVEGHFSLEMNEIKCIVIWSVSMSLNRA